MFIMRRRDPYVHKSPTCAEKVQAIQKCSKVGWVGGWPVQVQHGPQYGVWTGSLRGASSPPGHCRGALEQGTEPPAAWSTDYVAAPSL